MKTKSQRAAALEVMLAAQKQYELAMIELESHVAALEQQVALCDVDMKDADKDYVEQVERRRKADQERDAALARVRELEIENQRRVQDVTDITRWKDDYKGENAALRSLVRRYMAQHDLCTEPDEGCMCLDCEKAKQLLDKGDQHV